MTYGTKCSRFQGGVIHLLILNQPLFKLIEMLDILITYIVFNTRFYIRSRLSLKQTTPLLVTIAARSDPSSYNWLDLIQSLILPHRVGNGYI
jgi:hypothetical protein